MDLTERGDNATRHPWEVQRFEAYRRVLDDHDALSARRVLDVGSGDGWFAERLLTTLADDARIVCWDTNYEADELDSPTPGIVRTSAPPEPGHDLVLALDVLEHIEHADEFVTQSLRPLAERGTPVLVSVPAYQRLFSAHDSALGHHRRYGRRELRSLIDPWVEIVDEGSLFTSLLLPRAAQVAVEGVRSPVVRDHGIGAWSGGRTATAIVSSTLAADASVGRLAGRFGVRLPGLSHWAFGTVR